MVLCFYEKCLVINVENKGKTIQRRLKNEQCQKNFCRVVCSYGGNADEYGGICGNERILPMGQRCAGNKQQRQ